MRILILLISVGLSPAYAAVDLLGVPEDGAGAGKGFVIPNENDYQLFNQALSEKKGALVVVGTFRAFHDAAMGQFEEVIALDYASEVVRFNMHLVRLIQVSKDRLDFLSRLTRNPNARDVFRRIENNEIHENNIRYELGKLISQQTINTKPIDPIDENFYRFHIHNFDAINFVRTLVTEYYPSKKASFVTDDHAFFKLKTLAMQGRIHPIRGDLGGTQTLLAVGNELKKKSISISVLDISNSFSYIHAAKNGEQFLANLQTLPFSPDAAILFTEYNFNKFVGRMVEKNWNYYAAPFSEYLAEASVFASAQNYNIFPAPYQVFTSKRIPLNLSPMSCSDYLKKL